MLMAAAAAVKAAPCFTRVSRNFDFDTRRSRNNRFAYVSRKFSFVFRDPIGRGGFATADTHPVQGEPHALRRDWRAL